MQNRLNHRKALLRWIMLCLLSLSISPLRSQPANSFDRLSIEQGLSQATVTSMLKDRKGFMWFATEDGLNRYDGYNFKLFRYNYNDTTTISSNTVKCIYEDRDGVIWAGTADGLNKFSKEHQSFQRYYYNTNDKIIRSNQVNDITEDAN